MSSPSVAANGGARKHSMKITTRKQHGDYLAWAQRCIDAHEHRPNHCTCQGELTRISNQIYDKYNIMAEAMRQLNRSQDDPNWNEKAEEVHALDRQLVDTVNQRMLCQCNLIPIVTEPVTPFGHVGQYVQ